MLRTCGGQVRAARRGAYGLDFGSILALGSAMGADLAFLAEMLPITEVVVVDAYRKSAEDDDGE